MKTSLLRHFFRINFWKSPRSNEVLAIFLTLMVLFSTGCSRQSSSSAAAPGIMISVPVSVATVTLETVPLELTAIGNVEAFSTVAIKSQVAGPILQVHFQEGQYVKKGDLLFTIDPRPFEASVRQAESILGRDQAQLKQVQANLERDLAQLKLAETQAKRYANLQEQGIVAPQLAEQYQVNQEALAAAVNAGRAAIENAQAAIRADQASLENTKLLLSYCTIQSPIDARTGRLEVHQGNIVKANETPALVNLHQVNPIFVNFSVPEQYLAQIKKFMAQGRLATVVQLPGAEAAPLTGWLSFVDNTVNETTGTIQLKARFDNQEKTLWPGQFINVSLRLSTQPNAVVVPGSAVQTGQQGLYLYVVKPDMTVENRPVKVERNIGLKSVIAQGASPGERVVTDGHLRLVPGAKIEIKNPATATPTQEKAR